ncbi:hypothetical protein EVAR_100165_1 [Eumeta japonica]|uniref:Uncharacterized protein n=1 Tax=Eumeta variegata TaxID=151549 RepID=A0A4C1ZRL8_EUMVA|nr:hypothetical protein EVAR_100165_1 [Eumeta japonica]
MLALLSREWWTKARDLASNQFISSLAYLFAMRKKVAQRDGVMDERVQSPSDMLAPTSRRIASTRLSADSRRRRRESAGSLSSFCCVSGLFYEIFKRKASMQASVVSFMHANARNSRAVMGALSTF